MTAMPVGAHVPAADPLGEAAARGAEVVQLFLSSPQTWKAPRAREDADRLATSGMPIYVHAPYLVNVASPNNRVRIPSRKILAQTVAAAADIGARGVVVHGGSVGPDEDLAVACTRWRKALDSFELAVPVLVENTAGRGNTVVQDLANYGPLWEAIGGYDVGVCFDTCHAWAAGFELGAAVDLLRGLVGGIALVHGNDSRDPQGSHRDRHANLGAGEIPEDRLVAAIRAAEAPVVVETPGGAEDQARDVAWLRERLG